MPKKPNLKEIMGKAKGAGGVDAKEVMAQARAKAARAKEPSPVEDVAYEGTLESDAIAEAEALQESFREPESEKLRGFKERAKNEERRRMLATDSEFWVALCFQDRDQKEAFLGAIGMLAHGDKYLDGQKVAEALGVEIPASEVSYRPGKVDPKLAGMSRPLPD